MSNIHILKSTRRMRLVYQAHAFQLPGACEPIEILKSVRAAIGGIIVVVENLYIIIYFPMVNHIP